MSKTTATVKKLYQQVASAIEEAIVTERYKTGDRLPAERDLAEEFAVSRATVREAMLALEIRDLVAPRHGSGIYVKENSGATVPRELDIGAFEPTEARLLFGRSGRTRRNHDFRRTTCGFGSHAGRDGA